jgi:hypothetical protein
MRIAIEKMASKPQGFRSLKMAGHDAWEWEEKATDRWSYTRLWCGDRSAFSASLSWPLRLSKPAAAVRILDSFRDISPSTVRSIGLPELLVIGVVMMLALPAALIVWIVMSRSKKGLKKSVRPCPKCGQEIPSQASFCSLCGKRVV